MKIKYTDFEGVEREVDADVTVDLETGHINSELDWEEKKVVLRVNGKIVGRTGICYREVERS